MAAAVLLGTPGYASRRREQELSLFFSGEENTLYTLVSSFDLTPKLNCHMKEMREDTSELRTKEHS